MKLLYPLAKRFIAGYDFDSAKIPIDNLIREGYEVSIDYLGELSKTFDDCVRAREQYLQIIDFYKKSQINISIKPTQLGLSISESMAYNFVWDIAEEASKYDHTIRLDMEDSNVTDKTIRLCLKVKSYFPNIGIALQANLFRTEEDLNMLMDEGVSVRLVKGAYKEKVKIANQNPSDISSSFFHYACELYSNKANKPAIATHDEELLADIGALIPDPSYFDYEFLYGVRRDLQRDMKNKDFRVRIYVPFGSDWLPYTLRRLREWKNFKFVATNIFLELTNPVKKAIFKYK